MRRTIHTALLLITLATTLAACAMPSISLKRSTPTPEPSATPEPSPTATEIVLRATQTPMPTATPTPIPLIAPSVSVKAVDFEEDDCPFDETGSAKVTCGYVEVPEDHFDPDGKKIRLAVAVFKNTSGGRRPDAVIYLDGGPGGKTMEDPAYTVEWITPMIGDRDLIIYDQRGVGESEPALECPELDQRYFEDLVEVDSEKEDKGYLADMETCQKRLVRKGIDLSKYNTLQSAADVEAIRLALKYDKLNLLGVSYGTQLAQAVMRDHPQGVRSVILASVDPLQGNFMVDVALTVTKAITLVVQACAEDDACSTAYPDLEREMYTAIDKLNENPAPITVTNAISKKEYPAMLSGDDMFGNLVQLLYYTELIPIIPRAISEASRGEYALMAKFMGVDMASYDSTSRGVRFSVLCADDLIGRTEQDYVDNLESLPEQLRDEDPDAAEKYGPFAMCRVWGVPEVSPGVKKPLISDIPTLIVEGQYDPVTPPEYGRKVAEGLKNSYYYEFPNAGHDAAISVECGSFLVRAFLDDPMTRPDVACTADPEKVEFAVPLKMEDVSLEPYVNKAQGFKTIVPKGWKSVNTGMFMRSSSALDPTMVAVFSSSGSSEWVLDYLTEDYRLTEPPKSIGTEQIGELTWDLYELKAEDSSGFLGTAEDGGKMYMVILSCETGEAEQLYDWVFVPVLEATEPLD